MSADDVPQSRPSQRNRPSPLAPEEVARLIRSILEQSGPIVPTRHFLEQGRERNFDIQDAMEVLRTFASNPRAVWNDRHEAWNYDVEGSDLEGEPLTVRVAFSQSRTKLILVTGF